MKKIKNQKSKKVKNILYVKVCSKSKFIEKTK
jgi:hypothetical protein